MTCALPIDGMRTSSTASRRLSMEATFHEVPACGSSFMAATSGSAPSSPLALRASSSACHIFSFSSKVRFLCCSCRFSFLCAFFSFFTSSFFSFFNREAPTSVDVLLAFPSVRWELRPLEVPEADTGPRTKGDVVRRPVLVCRTSAFVVRLYCSRTSAKPFTQSAAANSASVKPPLRCCCEDSPDLALVASLLLSAARCSSLSFRASSRAMRRASDSSALLFTNCDIRLCGALAALQILVSQQL
mmetsp:Transcript_75348/g.179043  ORF Transcript_75348/g.179043 Transcript_75348/m.179043 type:complete len:244 (+) Transcript_75348:1721-2452(+)